MDRQVTCIRGRTSDRTAGAGEGAQLSLAMTTEDIVEGVTAFFEKREPQWKGR